MSGAIVIVRFASIGALGRTASDAVAAMIADRYGVRDPSCLEQVPQESKGVGEALLVTGGSDEAFRAELLLRAAIEDALAGGPGALLSADPGRNAAVIGTTVGGMRHCGEAIRLEARGDPRGALASFARIPAGTVLRRALRGLPVAGPRVTISCACASALSAVAHACALLRSGAVDTVLAGGYDPVSEFVYGGFSALQLVARGPLSPFSKDREGMKLGEGSAIFVLRRADDTARLGLPIMATIEGLGESSDAHHLTHPHPDGAGAAAAIGAACGRTVPDLLLAHATGTEGNDAAEYRAYRTVFGERLADVPVAALKSRLGHPLGAAGALELAIAIESAARGIMPSGGGRAPDLDSFPGLRLLRGPAAPGRPSRIVALAAGFGGANAAVAVSSGSSHPAPVASSPPRTVALAGWGAVCAAGRGTDGIRGLAACDEGNVPDSVLAGLIDRVKYRRIAMLPRLMIAAIRDLCATVGVAPDALAATPVLCATWHGAAEFTERYYRDLIASGIDLANPLLFAESVPNVGSGHVSIGLGITAPCASVVGSRSAGLEACALAISRIACGSWDRAIVVAGEEAHPLIDTVLGHSIGKAVHSRAAAVALLMQASAPGDGRPSVRAGVGTSRAGSVTSGSPVDADAGARRRPDVPECGAATPLAVAMLESSTPGGRFVRIASQEPGGAPWWLGIEEQREQNGEHVR